ncbi:MAG: ScpA family protein [Dehalococcoidia bacterium]
MNTGRPAFAVSLDVFEGPLDLLLALIERRELDITVISLVAVTDQFLRYFNDDAPADLNEIAAYLVVAAKLLLIKSIRLLPPDPRPQIEGDADPVEAIDAVEALARQLREYRRFKVAAAALRERDEQGLRSWPRRHPLPPGLPRRLEIHLPAEGMVQLLLGVARRAEPPNELPLPSPKLTVAERIEEIRPRLSRLRPVRFQTLLGTAPTVELIVATFLAVLELYRRKEIEIDQPAPFAEIALRRA